MSREDVIEKIKKLLALSENNSNEREAIAAALKAQKLIAKYDIQDNEVNSEEVDEVITISSPKYAGKQWRLYLAATIADNFRCKAFQSRYRHKEDEYKLRNVINFVGYSQDAKAATLIFQKMVDVGELKAQEAARLAKRLYGTSQGAKNTYYMGFIRGLASELEKQSKELMLVTPQAVKDEMNKLNLTKASFQMDEPTVDMEHVGFKDGKDAIRSSRLDTSDNYLLE